MSDAGLRVATWEDERGEHGELTLPKDLLWRFEKMDQLKSERARGLNEIRTLLAEWSRTARVPVWMRWDEARRAGPLLQVLRLWERCRFDGDSGGFERAVEWRRRHLRLRAWEEHLRDQTLRRRRDVYRQFVSRLVADHGAVFIEDTDLRATAARGGGKDRVIACPSLLRRLLEEKGGCIRLPEWSTGETFRCERERAQDLLRRGLWGGVASANC